MTDDNGLRIVLDRPVGGVLYTVAVADRRDGDMTAVPLVVGRGTGLASALADARQNLETLAAQVAQMETNRRLADARRGS